MTDGTAPGHACKKFRVTYFDGLRAASWPLGTFTICDHRLAFRFWFRLWISPRLVPRGAIERIEVYHNLGVAHLRVSGVEAPLNLRVQLPYSVDRVVLELRSRGYPLVDLRGQGPEGHSVRGTG